MRLYLLILLALSCIQVSSSQVHPVKWSFSAEQIKDNEFEVRFTANIQDKWAIYSQHNPEGGPIPTSFEFDPNEKVEILGEVIEPKEIETGYDRSFDMVLTKLKGEAVFTQKVRCLEEDCDLSGYVTFMSCDNTKCLPPEDVDFKIKLN